MRTDVIYVESENGIVTETNKSVFLHHLPIFENCCLPKLPVPEKQKTILTGRVGEAVEKRKTWKPSSL